MEARDALPLRVRFTDTLLTVDLADGRSISTSLDWYPRLARASRAERGNVELGVLGLHWPDIDEDLRIAGMLAGRRAAA